MCYDVVWCGMVWYGEVWCGMVQFDAKVTNAILK